MSNASTRYNPRFELDELIQQDRDELISCPVYLDGALVAPSAGTVSLYNDANVAVVDGEAVSVVASVATYTVTSATVSSETLGRGWRVVWSLTMADGLVHTLDNAAHLIRRRLYPTISDVDIARGRPHLSLTSADRITTDADDQDYIDEADVEIQNRLLQDERRPYLIVTPTVLRPVWLALTIALIYEGLAAHQPDPYSETAKTWRARYEAAYTAAKALFDYDQDGHPDSRERQALKPSVLWTC